MNTLLLLAILSGMFFTVIGVAYRIGEPRKISSLHIILVMSLFGMVFFLVKGFPLSMPPRVWLWALATGLTQYVAVNLVKWALKKGPLSALWCAISLSFLPVVAWSYAYFGERLTLAKSLGIMLAIGCVVASSKLSKPDSSTPLTDKPKFNFLYGLILVAVIVLNSLTYVGSKDLAMWHVDGGQSYIDAFGGGYLFILYAVLFLSCLCQLLVQQDLKVSPAKWLGLGLLATIGSVMGMLCLTNCASLEAASWTLSAMGGIVSTALISVLFFGEKVSPAWLMTIGFGVAAAALNFEDFFYSVMTYIRHIVS